MGSLIMPDVVPLFRSQTPAHRIIPTIELFRIRSGLASNGMENAAIALDDFRRLVEDGMKINIKTGETDILL